MNIQIAVSGKRATDRVNMISWLQSKLSEMGADITILQDGTVSVVADKGFLATASVPETLKGTTATTPVSILVEAHKVIYDDREKTHGDPGKNLRTIAVYWNTHIAAAKSVNAGLTENDVAGMMILLKQARNASNPNHRDNLVDIAGYAGLQDRIQQSKTISSCSSNGNMDIQKQQIKVPVSAMSRS